MLHLLRSIAHCLLIVKDFFKPFFNFRIEINRSVFTEFGRQSFHFLYQSFMNFCFPVANWLFRSWFNLSVGNVSQKPVCKLGGSRCRSYVVFPVISKIPKLTGLQIVSDFLSSFYFFFFVSDETSFLSQFLDPNSQTWKECACFCRFGCYLCVFHNNV